MAKFSRLRQEKRRLVLERDAAQMAAARALFMAGMAAQGFSPEDALRAWRRHG